MIVSATGLVAWTPTAGQTSPQTIRVIVSDGLNDTTQTFAVTVGDGSANAAPLIVSSPRLLGRVGATYQYRIDAFDANGDALAYSLDAKPAGMDVDPKGLVSWPLLAADVGAHAVTLNVSDGHGGRATQSFVVNVLANNQNSPPLFISSPRDSALVGSVYSYGLIARDDDGDPVRFRLVSGPAGTSLDPDRGTLRWLPTEEQMGNQTVVVEVSDGIDVTTQTFGVFVRCVNLPPAIVSAAVTTANAGTDYYYAVRASDPERDAVSFRLLTDLAGTTIDERTGFIRWRPSAEQAGTRRVVVQATDALGAVGTQSFDVVVVHEVVTRLPFITSAPKSYAAIERAYEYQVRASDPDGDGLTYELVSAPAGVQVDPATGLVTWTPRAEQLDSFRLTVSATDPAGGKATQSFDLIVTANHAPVIDSTPKTTVTAGAAYRYDVRASDADRDALTYELTTKPAGMTITRSGRITWAADLGSHDVEVVVRDGSAEVRQSFTLVVSADVTAPRVQLGFSSNVITLGGEVRLQLRATDDVAPVSQHLTVGGVEVPIASDGSAVYAPTQAGLLEVRATSTDAAGNTGETTFQLRVIDPSDVDGPEVVITSPSDNGRVTYLTDVIGTVRDTNLEFYRVEYARPDQVDLDNLTADDPDWVVLARGTSDVVDGKLATFDPTVLANDNYVIRTYAQDTSGHVTTKGVIVSVEGEAKLGRLNLSFTDLSVPLAGFPIEVTRVYDSFEAKDSGDFGFGWSLGLRDAKIRETVPDGGDFVAGKTRVFLTTPDGRRVGFTYQEVVTAVSFFGAFVRPYFASDPGVSWTLEVDDTQVGRGGIFGALSGTYNPDVYTLVAQDGTRYRYDQGAGRPAERDRP